MGTVLLCSGFCLFGVFIGHRIRTKSMLIHEQRLEYLAEEVKNTNNQMVTNLSKAYQMSESYVPGEFSEVDQMLMDMWID